MRFFLISIVLLVFNASSNAATFPVTAKYGDVSNLTTYKNKKASPDIPGWLVLDIGFNFLIDENEAMNRAFFGSKSAGIYYMKALDVSNKLDFNVSLGIASEKFAFAENIALTYDQVNASGPQSVILDSLNFAPTSNKLAVTYIDLPFELRYFPSKKTGKKSYFIALGANLGVRISSHTKLKYTENELTFKTKLKEDYNLSALRYGLSARAGWRGFSVYYKQYLSTLFNPGEQPLGTIEEPRTSVLGVSFSLF